MVYPPTSSAEQQSETPEQLQARIARMLSEIPGYEEDAKAIRGARPGVPGKGGTPSLTSGVTDPGNPSEVAAVEKRMREGGTAERRSILAAYGDALPGSYGSGPRDEADKLAAGHSYSMPWVEQRVTELQGEIPEVPTRTSWLAKAWGKVTDIAGQPIGAALKALDAPAEGVERLIGLAYFNEIPMEDRWQMAAVTYDTIWNDLFSGGNGGKREAVNDYHLGEDVDALTEKYHDAWGDGVGHFVLDPLNLIGGVGLVTKIPVVGKTGVARAIGRGVDFSKVPVLRDVPILGKIGQSPENEINQAAVRALNDARPGSSFTTPETKSGLRRLFQLTPQAQADQYTGHFLGVIAQFNDPRLWPTDGTGRGFQTVLNDMYGARPTNPMLFGKMFESSTPVRKVRGLLEGNDDLAQTWQRFSSLGTIDEGNAFWKGAKEALATTRNGEPTTLYELIRNKVPLSAEEAQRYASYRQAKLTEEFMTKGVGALHGQFGLAQPDWVQHMDRASAAMKSVMAMVVLNNPRFAAVNYTNNMFSVLTKGQDAGGAWRFARRLLSPSRVDAPTQRLMDEFGFSADYARAVSADTNFRQELLGVMDEVKMPSLFQKASTFWVELGSKFDTAGRHQATATGMQRAAQATWHLDGTRGGVIPNVPANVRAALPQAESWVKGLAYGNFADIDEFWEATVAGLPARPTAGQLAAAWAEETARTMDVAGDAWTPGLLAQQLPNGVMDEVDALFDSAGTLREAGNAEWASGLARGLDDLEDEMNLELYRKMLADKFEPMGIPVHTVRPQVIPWQDMALFDLTEGQRFEAVSRTVAKYAQTLGTRSRAQVAMQQLGGANERYRQHVQEILERTREAGLQVGKPEARRVWGGNGGVRDQWVTAFSTYEREVMDQLQGLPTVRREVQDLLEMQFDDLKTQLAERGAALGDPFEWGDTIRRMHTAAFENVERMYTLAALDKRTAHTVPEYFTTAGRAATEHEQALSFLEYTKNHMADLNPRRKQAAGVSTRTVLRDSDRPELKELHQWLYGPGGVSEAMRQRNVVMQIAGRAHRDFVMLNYSQKYGIDSALNILFPYQFFTTRTVRDWARLSLYRPGATAAIARVYEMTAEINEEAGLPDRLKRTIRIPIPFLDDMLPGASPGSIVFDPIRMLFPLASFQDREAGDRTGMTGAGQVIDYASQVGPAPNPLLTGGLGAMGALGDRTDWVRRSLASVQAGPLGFLPGPRGIRAAQDWLAGITEDPDPTVLTPDLKQRIARAEPLPEDWLRDTLSSVWDMASADGFEGYRVDRTIANMVAEDPKQWTPRAALEALRYHRGPLYQEAQKRARSDYGLRVLSGWALMPFNVYPEGEQVQRGLDAVYREVAREGSPEKTREFFQQHPEYRVRQIAGLDRGDPEGQLGELDTEMYYIDVGQVAAKYDDPIEKIRGTIDEAERRGFLQTKEGRRQIEVMKSDLTAIVNQKEAEIQAIEGLYPYRRTELSTKAAPHERALFQLREQYFGIKREDFKTAQAFYDARAAFVNALPAEGIGHTDRMSAAVQGLAIWFEAEDRIVATGARGDSATAIRRQRDASIEALTKKTQAGVSRESFETYLNTGARPRTPDRIEYQKASSELTEYFAIGEADGVSPASAKVLQRSFWSAHPLLQKYYGNDEPKAWNADSAAAYGRMDEIWQEYYDREDDEQGQRDYLAGKIETLNLLRRRVGLRPIQLLDWKPVEAGQLRPGQRAPQQQPASGPGAGPAAVRP